MKRSRRANESMALDRPGRTWTWLANDPVLKDGRGTLWRDDLPVVQLLSGLHNQKLLITLPSSEYGRRNPFSGKFS